MQGLVVINKPTGMTSRAAVDCIGRCLPRTRVGHAGTLDPLATGVLVVGIGAATRLLEYVQRMTKEYHATVRLGARSSTDDAAGEIEVAPSARVPSPSEVTDAVARFVGEIDQVPPKFSAAHVGGERAYRLARRGRDVELAPRRVRIDRIDILNYSPPRLELHIVCGRGTYIRALARDLGNVLGCGGMLERLERTRIGPFTLTRAITLPADADVVRRSIVPPIAALAELPKVTLSGPVCRRLSQGQPVRPPKRLPIDQTTEVALVDEEGTLVGVGIWQPEVRSIRPAKILARDA